tara:strand:- start:156 stop:542 length:387 start_codon:yes stop_codon:yes gene_type:complete
MSTLKVNNIQTTSGGSSSTPEQIQQGRAKLWLNYNGSTNAILDDFNVSTVGDEGTGSYTINITSGAFANLNFATVFGGVHTSGVALTFPVLRDPSQVTKNTSSFRIEIFNSGNVQVDTTTVSVACFGD